MAVSPLLSALLSQADPPAWEVSGRHALYAHQVPPAGDWQLWLLEGGRGAGKTEACSRYFAKYMHEHPGHRGRIIAPTFGDAVESCIVGPSGLKSIDPDVTWLPSAPGGAKVIWPNGSEALVLGTPFPKDIDRLRAGGNRHIDWWEEVAANAQLKTAWEQAEFGLRLGEHPHSIGSTTPRNTLAYRGLRDMPGVVRSHGTIDDNQSLPDKFREHIKSRYAGTRIGRQELDGLLLDDIEGALWSHQMLEDCRTTDVPGLVTVVVSIDPAASSGPEADDTGIIVAGLGTDGHGYILDDLTCHLSPEGWGRAAVSGYTQWNADRIVAEVNNGGEMVRHVISTVDSRVKFKAVHASRGKEIRAQPVAALYEQGRVHHVGMFAEMEDQLTTWAPGDADSPDRLDAVVWAVTDLMLGYSGPPSTTAAHPWTGNTKRRKRR